MQNDNPHDNLKILKILQTGDNFTVAEEVITVLTSNGGLERINILLGTCAEHITTINVVNTLILLRSTFRFRSLLSNWKVFRDCTISHFSPTHSLKIFSGLM